MSILKTILCRLSVLLFALGWSISAPSALAGDGGALGGVNTSFHILGSHDVAVSWFADPDLPVTCYLSRAQTGGFKGAVGIAKNPTRFALSCVKTSGTQPDLTSLPKQKNIDRIKNSFLFTKLVVTRMLDTDHHAVVYLVTSQGLIDGSPANTISAVSWP